MQTSRNVLHKTSGDAFLTAMGWTLCCFTTGSAYKDENVREISKDENHWLSFQPTASEDDDVPKRLDGKGLARFHHPDALQQRSLQYEPITVPRDTPQEHEEGKVVGTDIKVADASKVKSSSQTQQSDSKPAAGVKKARVAPPMPWDYGKGPEEENSSERVYVDNSAVREDFASNGTVSTKHSYAKPLPLRQELKAPQPNPPAPLSGYIPVARRGHPADPLNAEPPTVPGQRTLAVAMELGLEAALDLEPSNPNFVNVPHAEPNLPIRDATGGVRAVTQAEVLAHARRLGMDIEAEPDLLWIAEQALTAPLPEGWEECVDSSGKVQFVHAGNNEKSSCHPLEGEYLLLYQFHHSECEQQEREERLIHEAAQKGASDQISKYDHVDRWLESSLAAVPGENSASAPEGEAPGMALRPKRIRGRPANLAVALGEDSGSDGSSSPREAFEVLEGAGPPAADPISTLTRQQHGAPPMAKRPHRLAPVQSSSEDVSAKPLTKPASPVNRSLQPSSPGDASTPPTAGQLVWQQHPPKQPPAPSLPPMPPHAPSSERTGAHHALRSNVKPPPPSLATGPMRPSSSSSRPVKSQQKRQQRPGTAGILQGAGQSELGAWDMEQIPQTLHSLQTTLSVVAQTLTHVTTAFHGLQLSNALSKQGRTGAEQEDSGTSPYAIRGSEESAYEGALNDGKPAPRSNMNAPEAAHQPQAEKSMDKIAPGEPRDDGGGGKGAPVVKPLDFASVAGRGPSKGEVTQQLHEHGGTALEWASGVNSRPGTAMVGKGRRTRGTDGLT